jgi:type I restriction enzyme S subunit
MKKSSTLYIYYYLEKNFLRQAMKNTAKATVDSLRMDTLTKMPIELPSFEEQIKIANSLRVFRIINFSVQI